MVIIQSIILSLIGFAGGVIVAGASVAFISVLGIVPRLAICLGGKNRAYECETCIFFGGIAGSIISIFSVPVPIGIIGLAVSGLFFGIFVGVLAMALAETAKIIPIFVKQVKLKYGMVLLTVALACGKGLGTLVQMCEK